MSYRKHHVKSKIKKLKPKKSILKNKWFWFTFLIVAVLGITIWLLFFASFLSVNNIIISGNKEVKTENLKSIVEKYANKNIFLINTKYIQKEILSNFPEIKLTEVKKNYFKTLNIRVEERSAVAIFCVTENFESCNFIDDEAIIFKPSEVINDFVTVRNQNVPSNIVLGKQVLDKNILNAILKTQKILKDNYGVDIDEALLLDQFRLNIKTSENWQVYFTTDSNSDLNLQITKLNILLKDEISESARKNLQYIDLRFKDRAYYK